MHLQTGMLGAAKPPPASPANSEELRGTGAGSERLQTRLAPAAAAAARSRRRQQGPHKQVVVGGGCSQATVSGA